MVYLKICNLIRNFFTHFWRIAEEEILEIVTEKVSYHCSSPAWV